MDINFIKESIDKVDIVSFDIFDTLIFRMFNEPEDVFKLMEHILNIDDFKNLRIKSQQMASMKMEKELNVPHANLDEIYNYMQEHSDSDMNITWEEVKKFEIQVESDCLFCNKEIFAIYEYAKKTNKRIIAISDMYISKCIIQKILDKCGYLNFDEIYVSADLRKTKYVGDIYDEVIKIEKVNPTKILHIGDNYNSDVINAKKRGINTIHYDQSLINSEKISSNDLSVFESLNSGIVNAAKANSPDKDFWYHLGLKVGGPLYLGLLQWIEKELQSKNIDKIYFLSRDGYILDHIFKQLGIKESTYLYTSRRALLLASIDKLDDDALNNLPPYTFGQQVKEILEYLNIEKIEEKTVNEVGFNSLNSIIKDSADFNKMKKLFLLNEQIILKKCKEERENAKTYLNSIDFFNNKSIIFDCGWNGSSQYLLEKVLDNLGNNSKNLFLYAGIMDNAKSRRQLDGKNFKSYLFGHRYNLEIQEKLKDTIAILELFFGAPHSSVKRYLKEGIEFENIEPDHTHKQSICEGIQDYINQTYNFINKYNIEIKPEQAIYEMYRLINNPTVEEAITIGNLPNIDGFVAQKNEMKYIANLKLSVLIRNPRVEIYWPRGLVVRPDINIIVKWMVSKKYKLKKINSKKKNNSKVDSMKVGKVKRAINIIKNQGLSTFIFKLNKKIKNRNSSDNIYNTWIKVNECGIKHKEKLEYTPLISIVVPVYNVIDEQLIECINSVINQTYDNWELCLVDDASTWKSVVKVLKKYESNPKINVIYRQENGHISHATNDGIKVAKGDFIGFLDCDDILAPNAIYEVTKKLNEDKMYDFIYSDEDKLTADGLHRHSPFFKPDWSPDTFMSLMYTCHFSVYRKKIIDEIGGLRTEYNGAQDYDFTLRFTEKANKIAHISKILYHWREREESIASNPEAKPYALEAVKKCKEDALIRRGLKGTVEYVNDMFQYRVKYIDENNSLVSIIIPSKDNYDILSTCIESIKKLTLYEKYEILVIDNGSNEDNRNKYEQLCKENNCTYYYEKMEFNFSKMCNIGSKIANGDYFLFLNDDIEVLQEDWLEILLGHACIEHVGAVGAKLLYPNSNTIQHIGITNLKIGPSHSLIGFDDRTIYYYGRNRMDYNFIAVTGACLMISKGKFFAVNSFDEDLGVAYNDVDLCFKLIEKGYYNVVRNDVVLYHHESISRGNDDINEEKKERLLKERNILFNKHEKYRGYDPFYNENLTECKVNYDIKYNITCNKLIEQNKQIKNKWFSKNCIVCIDSISIDNNVTIEGWTFMDKIKINNFNSKYVVLIDKNDNNLVFSTETVIRGDVTKNIKGHGNLNLSGFICTIDLSLLKEKEYNIGVLLENRLLGKKGFIITDKKITLISH